jgi:hypothetical protein
MGATEAGFTRWIVQLVKCFGEITFINMASPEGAA